VHTDTKEQTLWCIEEYKKMENPAWLTGVYDRLGSIEVRKESNLVILDETCNVLKTYVHGRECR